MRTRARITLARLVPGRSARRLAVWLAVGLTSLTLVTAAVAAGELDPTFDGDGKVATNIAGGNSSAQALALQPDGKLIAAGSTRTATLLDFALARYNANGTLDASFDGDGKVTTNFTGRNDVGTAVAIQPDGKIVVAGYTDTQDALTGAVSTGFALVRYNADGSLDTGFGGDGMVTTRFAASAWAFALVLQPDGKLVAAGYTNAGANPNNFALVRYHADGSLDGTFGGGDGKVVTDVAASWDEASALVLQPDGKLVAAGATDAGGGSFNFALVRYNADGSLDAGFDGDGKVVTDFVGGRDQAFALVLQPDGKLVAAGYAIATIAFAKTDFALARYNADGSLDASFDGDGKAVTDFAGEFDQASALVLQPDGRLVAAGYTGSGSNRDFALIRYNADGSLDSSFDGDGKLTTHFGPDDRVRALVLQPDGKLVAAGLHHLAFALARYLGDVPTDTTPPTIACAAADGVWHGDNVTIACTASDASGLRDAADASFSLSTSVPAGSETADAPTGTREVCDAAANCATAGPIGGNKVDRKAPEIGFGAMTPSANANGWHNSDVSIPFSASDAGSGVGGSIPPASPLVLTNEGSAVTGVVTATDAVGNSAAATSPAVMIDKTSPTVSYGGNEETYTVDLFVDIRCSAADALSGVETHTCADAVGPAYGFPLGDNVLAAGAVDRAGNTASASTSFTVIVTFDSLPNLVRRFVENVGIEASLVAKLEAAKASAARGQDSAERGQLDAFVDHVRAQSGKHLSTEHAEVLIRLAKAA